MKKLIIIVIALSFSSGLMAKRVSQLQADTTGIKMPVVNGGLKLQMTTTGLTMKNVYQQLYASPGIGGEIGGFLDFNVKPHFVMQIDLSITGEHMYLHNSNQHDDLWIFGLEIPLYLMGRWETTPKGSYIQFGGGPFTHFVLRSLMTANGVQEDVFKRVFTIDDITGENARVLGDNYSGLGIILTYEWAFGLQLNANFLYSISDILNYEHPSSTFVRPYKFSFGVGYRF